MNIIIHLFLVCLLVLISDYNSENFRQKPNEGLIINHPDMSDDILPIFYEWVDESILYETNPNWNNVKFIQFSDTLSSDFAGLQIDNEGIYLNSRYQNHECIKVIIYHELGHGMFGLDHDTSRINIMGTFINDFICKVYINNWDLYKAEYWQHIQIKENK